MQFVAGTRSRKSSEKARRSRNPFLPYNSLRERVPENHARFPQPISTMQFVAGTRSRKSSAHGRHPHPVCRRQNILEARLGFSARLPDHLANVGEGREMPFAASRVSATRAPLPSAARGAFGAASLFPAKREVKREVSKAWQAWPGNQTSGGSLVRSLVCAAARGGGLRRPRPPQSEPLTKRT